MLSLRNSMLGTVTRTGVMRMKRRNDGCLQYTLAEVIHSVALVIRLYLEHTCNPILLILNFTPLCGHCIEGASGNNMKGGNTVKMSCRLCSWQQFETSFIVVTGSSVMIST